MQRQSANILIQALALVGVTATIEQAGAEPRELGNGRDNSLHLEPGTSITLRITSDDRWLEAQQRAADQQAGAQRDDVDHTAPTDLDAAARADVAAHPEAGPDLSGGTPAFTPTADDDTPPNTGGEAGAVVSDTGATRTVRKGKQ